MSVVAAAAPALADRDIEPAELEMLADILRRRGVRRLAYFHCDHFEPWSRIPGVLSPEDNAGDVERFARASAANEFARRLTLFYKPHVGFGMAQGASRMLLADPEDAIGFTPVAPAQAEVFAGAMRGLLDLVDHEIQVHVHHEHYTSNTTRKGAEMEAALARPEIGALDAARFELGLRLTLERARAETGAPLDQWFFVHGAWALAGSDDRICRIENEIEILMRNGCRGDFTFPAGRANVNPRHNLPFLVVPNHGRRAYDLREALPETALGNAAGARDKFFIWSSAIRHEASSLDTYSDWLRAKLKQPVRFAREILEKSFVSDGTLWFKTHAHSLHPQYRGENGEIRFPHAEPAVRRMIGTVCDAADRAGAAVAFVTAGEAYDAVISPQPEAATDFRIEVPLPVAEGLPHTEPLRHAEAINAVAIRVVLARSAELGINPSGAGNYYQKRAEQGSLLMDYERRIADELAQRRHLFTTAIEIGSGVSVLPMLLGANGVPAIGIERDVNRIDAARAIEAAVAEDLPDLARHCAIIRGVAPDVLRTLDLADAALIFTNITATIEESDAEELLALSRCCRFLVMDLSRFFVERDLYEQDALRQRVADHGWVRANPLGGSYWLFESEYGSARGNR